MCLPFSYAFMMRTEARSPLGRAVLREQPGAKAGEALTQATAKHAKRSPCGKETDVLFGACGFGMALRYASSGHG